MENHAIIVAGGTGSRMQSNIPKQFLILGDRPILMHTLEVFHQCQLISKIILVLPSDHIETWKSLVSQYNFQPDHTIVEGGDSRSASVSNGLNQIIGDAIVAVHDGARPLISSAIIERTITSAHQNGNGVAAVKIKDSLREVRDGIPVAVDRSKYYAMQTPQTFSVQTLKAALKSDSTPTFTDDASAIESYGEQIHLVEGSYENLKITTKEDLTFAESILANRK